MSAPVFIADPDRLHGGDRIVLDGEDGRHAAIVRRIAPGEGVDLTDGAGHLARCIVVATDRQSITCAVHSRVDIPRPQLRVVVVQAIPKADRGEAAVESMTEVGVDEIVPWAAERCIARWRGDRAGKSLQRWRSTAREAAKQSRRCWLPWVADVATTPAVVMRVGDAALGVVLHEQAATPLSALDLPPVGDVVLVVGPEGGVTPAEVDALQAAGAVTARLGPTVLRTSTAGTVAAGILLARTSRWA
jgi:16S rRNA (uracil1498-N3)-methyltransferase